MDNKDRGRSAGAWMVLQSPDPAISSPTGFPELHRVAAHADHSGHMRDALSLVDAHRHDASSPHQPMFGDLASAQAVELHLPPGLPLCSCSHQALLRDLDYTMC